MNKKRVPVLTPPLASKVTLCLLELQVHICLPACKHIQGESESMAQSTVEGADTVGAFNCFH